MFNYAELFAKMQSLERVERVQRLIAGECDIADERIAVPMEDPIIHTATTGYYCSSLDNPDWATCPCRVAMEEQVQAWQAEQGNEVWASDAELNAIGREARSEAPEFPLDDAPWLSSDF